MNFEMTIATLVAAAITVGFAFYKSRQPRKFGSPWSVPWNGVIFVTFIVILVMINHLLTLNKQGEAEIFTGAIDGRFLSQGSARP